MILLDLLHLPGSEIQVQNAVSYFQWTPLLAVIVVRREKDHVTLDYGSERPTIVGWCGLMCVCIYRYSLSLTVLMLKGPRKREFALWRNAEIKFEMNLLCKTCFIIWKRDEGLSYFTLCGQHLSFLFNTRVKERLGRGAEPGVGTKLMN